MSSPRPVYSSLIPKLPNPKVSLECPTLECPGVPKCPRVRPRVSRVPNPQSLSGVPNPKSPWSAPESLAGAQPQSLSSLQCKVFLECRTCSELPSPRVAQPQSLPGVPKPRVSLRCPIPECRSAQPRVSPWRAQPQSVPGVPSHRSAQF